MKNQKGFMGVGVIIAIIVALAVGGGVVYYATKTSAPPSNTDENNYQNQNSITPTNPQNEGAAVRQKGNEAALKENMAGLRLEAEKVFDANGNSYENLCKNGVLNENTANVGYYVKSIISAQNTSTQSFPQIKCYSSKESYAIFALGQPPQTFEVVSLCSDSTGYSGKGEIDQTNLKCKAE